MFFVDNELAISHGVWFVAWKSLNRDVCESIIAISGVCSFSWNLDIFHVNSKKLGVQAPQKVNFE